MEGSTRSGPDASTGAMDWLNEAVANVASNIGLNSDRRGDYATVSTYDDDDDYRHRR